ncbi:hypothetical protein [Gorillibacterium sp. CAU 1737]|uniref:hypothetical protein n=1 Tax=Gorillibacterium sp. CAU 1737 TaxID=3140362 RepID=UPI003260F2BD
MAYHLLSEELDVRIAELGDDYKGARFDWNGLVTQVTWRGTGLTFCGVENETPGQGSGGIGICNEFGIEGALGYEEAAVGERFSKLGIGLLEKLDEDPYFFMRQYPIQPFAVRREGDERSVTFTVEPDEVNGYAARLEKTLTVEGNRLSIAYRLTNTGSQPIETDEYVHNFLRIGSYEAGPDYVLTWGGAVEVDSPEVGNRADLKLDGERIDWTGRPDGEFYTKLTVPEVAAPYTWELRHEPSGAYVRESGDYPIDRVALWGHAAVISPEVFIRLSLQPGETTAWTRTYEFFAK